jgi:hypothetical protein
MNGDNDRQSSDLWHSDTDGRPRGQVIVSLEDMAAGFMMAQTTRRQAVLHRRFRDTTEPSPRVLEDCYSG